MSKNFEEDARQSVPIDSDDRFAADDFDGSEAEGAVNCGAFVPTGPFSVQRSSDGRSNLESSELEWEFLTRWGLFKSPTRWNVLRR